jgi:hypothetical protein
MSDPQHIYARWLQVGGRTVFWLSVLMLVVYFSGALAPLIPLQELPAWWGRPAAELPHAGAGFLRYGDGLNLLAIALFSLISLACALRMVPAFARSGERAQAVLAALQALVLLAAVIGSIA